MSPCPLCISRTALRLHLVGPWGASARWTRTITTTPSFRSSSPPQGPNAPTAAATSGSLPVSAAPAGTILKGLNYFKNKQDPVAREEHEYPAWLWTVLDEMKWRSTESEDVGDLYCVIPSKREKIVSLNVFTPFMLTVTFLIAAKSQKERRIAARHAAKLAEQGASKEEKIPILEQTVDLPFVISGATKPHVVAAVGGIGKAEESTITIGGEHGIPEITIEQAMKARYEVKKEKRGRNRAAIKEKNFLGRL